MDLAEKAQLFAAMHQREKILVLPNPSDVGSARLLEHMGFEALATTSAGFAHAQGRPDGGMGRDAALRHASEIAASTSLPVSADLENCFADEPEGVAATIAKATGTGIVGCSVEDATGNPDKPIYEFDLAVARVEAAVAVARTAGFPFTVTARSENFLHGRPDADDTIARLEAFEEAGADVVYAPGIVDPAVIARILAAVNVPLNVLAIPPHTASSLETMGVARASVGSGLSRAAFSAFYAGARELMDEGTLGYGWADRPFVDLNDIFS